MKKLIEKIFGVDTAPLEARKKIKTDTQIFLYGIKTRISELDKNFQLILLEKKDGLISDKQLLIALNECQAEIDFLKDRKKDFEKNSEIDLTKIDASLPPKIFSETFETIEGKKPFKKNPVLDEEAQKALDMLNNGD